jgi:peptide/nickel transport system substrate-binding protein
LKISPDFLGFLIALLWPVAAASQALVLPGAAGNSGGRLVYAERSEPKTFNPLNAADNASKDVLHRLMADLVHINRATFKTEPALAKSWTASKDGHHYVVELREGLRFSDGHPCDADDVVFSFQVYLDEKAHALQRDLLLLDGKPVVVRKLDARRVEFELPSPYAVADRLFDSFFILPRHLLEKPYREGRISEVWGIRTPASEIAGLGPFRLREYSPGQRVVLERNPYYWKMDAAGRQLPYLNELQFVFAGTEDMQVMRFQSGESDVLYRVGPRNYDILQKDAARRGFALQNLGAGLEFAFLFFNLGDLPKSAPASMAAHQAWFRRLAFRQAISAAIDRDALVRLAYLGFATPLAGLTPPGNREWTDPGLSKPVRSPERARQLLKSDGFQWGANGALLDRDGKRVEFTIVTSSSNSERVQMAGLIQDDLKQIGIEVHVVPLEFRSLLDRLQQTHEFEACVQSLASADADPNADMPLYLSSGSIHLWNPRQKSPATLWEAEIDALMRKQVTTLQQAARKKLFDRVQQIVAENLPAIPLVSPNILVGAKKDLGGFRPAIMEHYTLWNVEELYWRAPGAGSKR